ncbi:MULTISPECIES: hypothetical protein [Bacillus cereus group]|uniref:hypothetical protein n=1 Tax=Bacillus cereus group TaxID=86661 RepID=UPI001E3A7C28|nr:MULTISPECIES: hypothetical protein [Bacillus cereus group]MCC2502211.1 hypothetical protein [Bacillus paranthracis]MDF9578904.1 hypothetical protein [Bacillus paranthracis]MDG1613230.1 hypothetical protein [Bacillus paranthracis]
MNSELEKILDNVIIQSNEIFHEFLCAYTIHNLGNLGLDSINRDALVRVKIDNSTELEPVIISDLINFNKVYPDFLLESFHGKFIQLWHNCLDDIFSLFVDLHFNNTRKFPEFKKRTVSIDFSSGESVEHQLKLKLKKDFSFEKFSDKQKWVNKILNPNKKADDELLSIKKNVLVRNAVQHHDGKVYEEAIKELGGNGIQLLDDNGDERNFSLHERCMISIPELYKLKTSILLVSQMWRRGNCV